MKRFIILLLFGLFTAATAHAEKVEGVIILKNDSIIHVYLNIPIELISREINFEKLQGKVKYFDSFNNKVTLTPDQAKEIRFKYQYEDIRMISIKNDIGIGSTFSSSSNIFLRIQIDGNLRLFNYYYTQRTAGSFNSSTGMMTGSFAYSSERFILQKGKGVIKRPRDMFFRKDMVEYFSDCPELAKKIESKELTKDDMEDIVIFYNKNCSK